ncbi:hypothetical protein TNCT_28971 [Trichonephila clavata]|uniref:Uncharacterized protein n=1 Tax=Trichonephila clavata TaxID=2740835 RepID=A0A8X6LCL0_TRICU|nr:hypothetical protein TNCT_28971 [Trichonephila clavata]
MAFIDLSSTCTYLGIDKLLTSSFNDTEKKIPAPKMAKRSRSGTLIDKKQVRFMSPPYTNCEKSVTAYSVTELLDVFERFVNMEVMDRKKYRHKMSLHKIFHFLFNCYEDWIVSYLLAYDKRRKKPYVMGT